MKASPKQGSIGSIYNLAINRKCRYFWCHGYDICTLQFWQIMVNIIGAHHNFKIMAGT